MKRANSLFAALVVGALMLSDPVAAEEPKSAEEVAVDLVEISGGAKMATQLMDTFMAQVKPAFPAVPDEVWTEFSNSLDEDELIGMMVPIYVKHFSKEELEALLEFYRTPLGQRLIDAMPAVMQDSMAVGAEWGRRKAAEIIERLQAQGYEPVST